MKKIFTLIITVLCAAALFAQAPEKFTYQAVVRLANNSLAANTQIGVRISILQGTVVGNAVFVETHIVQSNANGLITLEIGNGNVQLGSISSINWSDGPYFLRTETDPYGGVDYIVTSTQQMMSVPYALYAKEAGNGFSGDYNDLTNTPIIPTVPENVSAFTNDAGYLTSFTEQQILTISNDTIFLTGGSFVKLPATSSGFSGDYNDLINTPTIPTVPTNVSAFTNDAGYLTSFTEQQVLSISNDTVFLTGGSFVKLPAGFDGDYNSLTNKPEIPTIPTNVSAFSNDANYITENQLNAYNFVTAADIPAQVNADWNATSGAAEILNKPTIPTNVSELTNDANYITINDVPDIPTVPTNVSAFTNDAGYITDADIPEIPIVPTNVSAFTNDAGYMTSFTEQQVLSISNDTIFLSGGSFVKLPPVAVGFSGDYNDLTNKPEIPVVPTNVSSFTNDAGYLTDYTETDPQFNAWNKDYNDLINKPAIPVVPTNVSSFTNDAGYLTSFTEQQVLTISNDTLFLTGGSFVKLPATSSGFSGDYNDLINTPTIPIVPENVSAFINDAGYITDADIPEIPVVPTNVSVFNNDANYVTETQLNTYNYITAAEVPAQVNADWNASEGAAEILNKPTIPTTVSELTNDANYITINDVPEIPTVPENVSAFTNDAGYITNADIPEVPTVPTNVSVFTNDASYINNAECPDVDLCALAAAIAQLQELVEEQQHKIEELEAQIGNNTTDTTDTTISYECNPFLNIHDTTVIHGSSVTLSVMDTSISGVFWSWSGGQGTGNSITVTPTNNTTYYATNANLGPELIVNGDFEQGNVGFTSDYEYHDYQHGDRVDEGTYTIGTDPGGYVESMLWEHGGDHTTGTGNMLIVNGWEGDGIKTIWSQTVSVQPNTQYQFSYWVESLFPPHSQLLVVFNDEPQNDAFSGFSAYNLWTQNSLLWNSGQNTQVIIKFVELTNSVGGNDPCFDDISFRAVTGYNTCVDSVIVTVIPSGTTDSPIDTTTFECHPFLNIHDTTVNYGSFVTLSVADSSIEDVRWTWPGSSASGGSITVAPVGTTTYYATVSQYGPQLIVNGDFEQGNTGFETSYHSLNGENGSYMLDTIVPTGHWNELDHDIFGNGIFMYSDGYTSNDTATLWGQTVQVSPNTTYIFSMSAITLITPTPHLFVSVNGVDLIDDYPAIPTDWTKVQYMWQSGSATSAQIKIYNKNMAYWGNDFGIDNISFRAVIDSNMCVDSVLVRVDSVIPGVACSGTPTVTDYDGNVYNTVQIGEQCWMRENLRVMHYADGSVVNGAYHHTDSTVQTIYYLWNSVVNGSEGSNTVPSGVQGICPTGWHVPSAAEFDILIDYTNTYYVSNTSESTAKALAAKEGWNNSSNVGVPGESSHTNNTTGFSVAPDGCGYYGIYFQEEGDRAYLSSATSSDESFFRPFIIMTDNNQAQIGDHAQWYSFPVRCLRD